MDCIFCKIVNGDISSAKVYEDKNTLAFLDINPLNIGHTLVIPKKHYETIADIPEKELLELARNMRKVAIAVKKTTSAPGINIIQNNGRAAEQLVPHFHFHIIPRFENDGIYMASQKKHYTIDEMEEARRKIAESV